MTTEYRAVTEEQPDGDVIVRLYEQSAQSLGPRREIWREIGSCTFVSFDDETVRDTIYRANTWANQRLNVLAAGLYRRDICKMNTEGDK